MFPLVIDADAQILRTVCNPVQHFDDALASFVEEMIETMTAPDPETQVVGIGLAANQINVNTRVLLITQNVGTKKDYKILPMINPEILELSRKKIWMEEGCLSLPGVFGSVERPAKVKVRWQNISGNWCEKKLDKWDARIFLHEYDHLEGILFTDYPVKNLQHQRPDPSC